MGLDHGDPVLGVDVRHLALSHVEVGDDLAEELVGRRHGEGHDGNEQQGRPSWQARLKPRRQAIFRVSRAKSGLSEAGLQDFHAHVGQGEALDRPEWAASRMPSSMG